TRWSTGCWPGDQSSAEDADLERIGVDLALRGQPCAAEVGVDRDRPDDDPDDDRQRDQDHREQADPRDDVHQPERQVEVEGTRRGSPDRLAVLLAQHPDDQRTEEAQPAEAEDGGQGRGQVRQQHPGALIALGESRTLRRAALHGLTLPAAWLLLTLPAAWLLLTLPTALRRWAGLAVIRLGLLRVARRSRRRLPGLPLRGLVGHLNPPVGR